MRISDWSSDVCASDLEAEHGEGRHLYAAGGRAAPAADEHQHRGEELRGGAHGAQVDRGEAGGAGHDAVEEAVDGGVEPREPTEGGGVGPLPPREEHGAPSSSTTVTDTVSLAWRSQPCGPQGRRPIWAQTGNPRPPTMMSRAMVPSTTGSLRNPIMLSANRAKPALLKPDTAWKTPR